MRLTSGRLPSWEKAPIDMRLETEQSSSRSLLCSNFQVSCRSDEKPRRGIFRIFPNDPFRGNSTSHRLYTCTHVLDLVHLIACIKITSCISGLSLIPPIPPPVNRLADHTIHHTNTVPRSPPYCTVLVQSRARRRQRSHTSNTPR